MNKKMIIYLTTFVVVVVCSLTACSKGASSPVLAAMGLPPAVIDSALRVSLIYDTTPGQIGRAHV